MKYVLGRISTSVFVFRKNKNMIGECSNLRKNACFDYVID